MILRLTLRIIVSYIESMIFGFRLKKKSSKKTASEDKALITLGREQFKKLLERGISIPVALL